MKIVIDIDAADYHRFVNGFANENDAILLESIFKHGTLLPKGHGDLIDKEKLKNNINGWYAFMKNICKQPYMTLKQEEIIGKINMMTPIIEADKEEVEDGET